jgi:NDMA-dependent alcohol dehydrogenase
VKVGEHCVLAILPNCGTCRFCRAGTSYLCDSSAGVLEGYAPDGTHRIHARGRGLGAMSYRGTFCSHAVVPADSVIPISKTIPLETAALVGCGVPTGWGSAINAAEAKVGEVSVVIGVGGVGINAVQGFKNACSSILVAVDPIEFKREKAIEFGATHTAANLEEAQELVRELTNGVMADKAVMTVSVAQGELIEPAAQLIRKGGTLVVTAAAPAEQTHIKLDQLTFTMWNKRLQGAMYGSCNSHNDVPLLLDLYERGELMLDELVSKRYKLDEINQGYDDLHEGRILRGLITFDD